MEMNQFMGVKKRNLLLKKIKFYILKNETVLALFFI